MKPPLVSVCVPCHNAAAYLPAALDGVLAQTYPHVEIVCVDDGSTDDTPAVLADYADRHGVVVERAALGSAAKARNLAFARSRGAFVKYLDADDLISPDLIARQVDRLRGRPGCVASCGWVRFYGETPAGEAPAVPDPTHRDLPPVDWLLASAAAGDMAQCGMFLIPRGLIESAGGWDERLTLIDDKEFFGRILCAAERVLHADGTLYYRSGLAGSLSGRKGRAAYESAALAIEGFSAALRAREDGPRVRRVCADLAQTYYYEIAPHHPDLGRRLGDLAEACGGSGVRPSGGPVFHQVARVIGWKTASRLRSAAVRAGYANARRLAGRA